METWSNLSRKKEEYKAREYLDEYKIFVNFYETQSMEFYINMIWQIKLISMFQNPYEIRDKEMIYKVEIGYSTKGILCFEMRDYQYFSLLKKCKNFK